MNIDFLRKHGLVNADTCELTMRILQASELDPHPDSASGHIRAAMSISAHVAGYEAGDLNPEDEAILLATHGKDFGSAGEIGGVNVYADDVESWVVWVCNPMVSTWITVGQLLDDIGDVMQVVEWYGEPIKIAETVKHPGESRTVISAPSDVPDIPQQGGFANIPRELFEYIDGKDDGQKQASLHDAAPGTSTCVAVPKNSFTPKTHTASRDWAKRDYPLITDCLASDNLHP